MYKKLLIVTNHYLPGYKAGGPIKSISSICKNLKDDFDITVMTLNHDFGEKEPYKNIEFNKSINLNGYNVIYLSKINILQVYKHIKDLKPNIIYLNSFFSKFSILILILNKLRLINSSIILAPRGELSSGALSLKSNKKKLFLKSARIINLYSKDIILHSTDKIEFNDIKNIFPKNKIVEIANLSNLIVSDNIIDKKQNQLKIVFLSRISEKKNLLYALDILKAIDIQGITFDIYGPKEDITYWKECENIIKDMKNINVSYKGTIKPIEVFNILSNYHLFFLPTKNENFGHAIVEAMQVGVISLISDQTPWNDLEKYNAGWAISLNKKDIFIEKIKELLSYDDIEFKKKSNNVKKYISKKLNNNELIIEYIKMFNKKVK